MAVPDQIYCRSYVSQYEDHTNKETFTRYIYVSEFSASYRSPIPIRPDFLFQVRPGPNGSHSASELNPQLELYCSRKCHWHVQDGERDKMTDASIRRQMESPQHQEKSVKRLSTPTYASSKRHRSKYYGNQGNVTPKLETTTWHVFKFTNRCHSRCGQNCDERNDNIYKTILQGVHCAI